MRVVLDSSVVSSGVFFGGVPGEMMAWIARHADLVAVDVPIEPVSADRADDVFLACALAGGAGFIVSGDRHLKDVSGWREISVLSPRRFLDEALGSSTATG